MYMSFLLLIYVASDLGNLIFIICIGFSLQIFMENAIWRKIFTFFSFYSSSGGLKWLKSHSRNCSGPWYQWPVFYSLREQKSSTQISFIWLTAAAKFEAYLKILLVYYVSNQEIAKEKTVDKVETEDKLVTILTLSKGES